MKTDIDKLASLLM